MTTTNNNYSVQRFGGNDSNTFVCEEGEEWALPFGVRYSHNGIAGFRELFFETRETATQWLKDLIAGDDTAEGTVIEGTPESLVNEKTDGAWKTWGSVNE